MIALGISGGLNSMRKSFADLGPAICHDSSAVLLLNGKVAAAFEEERLNRIKHTNYFPVKSIAACLRDQGLTYDDVDFFTFSISEETLHQQAGNLTQGKYNGKQFLQQVFYEHTGFRPAVSKMKFYHHHMAHAAAAYFHSGFSNSLVATFDGVGDGISGAIYAVADNEFKLLKTHTIDDSVGFYYLVLTRFLGFDLFDEYKVMGLAPYGNPGTYKDVFNTFYTLLPEGAYKINAPKMEVLQSMTHARRKGDPITQVHMDIAASLQESLEIILFHVLEHFQKTTRHTRLCLAGGVALNGTFTGKLAYKNLFREIFVHPASADDGLAVGSALACHFLNNKKERCEELQTVYWGTGSADTGSVDSEVMEWSDFIEYETIEDASKTAAELIAENKVIGWFQGKSEYGPRALGNRSILADPRPFENKSRVNSIIKMREDFRPFAPSILKEHLKDFFELPSPDFTEAPFMTFVLKVKEIYRSTLGAVTHVDGSARLQTVSKTQNPTYWKLIEHFRQLTGIPIVLNTSFNNNVEPIVDTPEDAIICFLTNQLDYLIIENYLIKRKSISQKKNIAGMKIFLPDHVAVKPDKNAFILFDSYLRKSNEISPGLYELLNNKYDVSFNAGLEDEIRKLWEKRLIRVMP